MNYIINIDLQCLYDQKVLSNEDYTNRE